MCASRLSRWDAAEVLDGFAHELEVPKLISKDVLVSGIDDVFALIT